MTWGCGGGNEERASFLQGLHNLADSFDVTFVEVMIIRAFDLLL